MKKEIVLTVLSVVLSFSCFAQHTRELPAIKSNTETIQYKVNGETHAGWRISPQLKPDRLAVECKTGSTSVSFVTDVDSVTFSLNEGDTVRFAVLHNGQKAHTEVVGTPKNVNFTEEYIRRHQGKSVVEVPEVHELANILVALSKVGQQDSNMVDMTTPYYKEVMAHFAPYQSHPMLDTINKHIVKPFDNESYWYYYALKMNACGYMFNKKGAVENDGVIRHMGFGRPADPIEANLSLIEDFARKSGFREFYEKHQPYYTSLVRTYKELNPMDKMQAWLEGKFPLKYGSYRVIFSPLVGGAHATNRFEDNGFNQTVMFVRRAEQSDKYSTAVNQMLESRVVFTEIDHNFVNPISDRYAEQINTAFSNRQNWVNEANGTSAYSSPYKVFNEYMTWAVFSLYCLENFSQEEFNVFVPMMERQMERNRGFVKFSAFNQKLLALYKQNQKRKVDELYPEMLQWSQSQL